MEKQPKLILGFVSKFCAGKGAATSYLTEKHGFYCSSCSDRIREEILKQGKEINRENLQETGGKLRIEFGPAVLAQRTWEHISNSGFEKVVVDSIRGKEEVEFLKKIPGFYLIALTADQKIRFRRMLSRKTPGDPTTWEDFLKAEERDINSDGRNIEACLEMADYKIENNGTLEELHKKLDDLLEEIKK